MVAPDETTYAYVNGRPMAPKGELFERAVKAWRQLPTDAGASYDRTVRCAPRILLRRSRGAPVRGWSQV